MNTYIPIIMMLISLILIIITIFLLFYYNIPLYALILFIIGIIMGIIACLIFVYLRLPIKDGEKEIENVVYQNNDTYIDNQSLQNENSIVYI